MPVTSCSNSSKYNILYTRDRGLSSNIATNSTKSSQNNPTDNLKGWIFKRRDGTVYTLNYKVQK